MKAQQFGAPGMGQFNTLAQLATTDARNLRKKPIKTLHGKGADLSDKRMFMHRAKRKLVSNIIARELADLAVQKGNSELAKSFWNTYYCLDSVIVHDGRLHANYCKNRFCTVCAAIRKAEIVNKYLPIMQQWQDPHMVVLTVKSLSGIRLNALIDNMEKTLNKIIRKHAKRSERGKGIKLIGIRSLEITFNAHTREYHPHFHLIVANKESANILITEWLHRGKLKRIASSKKTLRVSSNCQFQKRIVNTKKDILETIKYSGKIITEPDLKLKQRRGTAPGTKRMIYLNALYTMFDAMHGRRIFSSFGFSLPKDSQPKKLIVKEAEHFLTFNFDLARCDWFDCESDSPLTTYTPDFELMDLLQNRIDRDLN